MKKRLALAFALLLILPAFLFAESLVVYFSATGNTERVARIIAEETGADLIEITPRTPYTSADINWRDRNSRASIEHRDPSLRPEITNTESLSDYDTVFIGYPIWWGEAPHVVYTFVESVDLDGKTVVPFATSSSSPLGSSGRNLASASDGGNWLNGQRFRSRVDEREIREWLSSLDLN